MIVDDSLYAYFIIFNRAEPISTSDINFQVSHVRTNVQRPCSGQASIKLLIHSPGTSEREAEGNASFVCGDLIDLST